MVERVRPKKQVVVTDVGGRPTQYLAAYPKTCAFMAGRGATIAEMADACSVTTRTFYRWMNRYPELYEAVYKAQTEVFNPRVERALAELAAGFEVDVEEVFFDKDGEEHRYTVRKYYPPNVTAGIYWTKNHLPNKYRDMQRVDVTAPALRSSAEIRQQLLLEFKDLIDQGLLKLPAPRR
jgi:AcrR family transcriptional regulator